MLPTHLNNNASTLLNTYMGDLWWFCMFPLGLLCFSEPAFFFFLSPKAMFITTSPFFVIIIIIIQGSLHLVSPINGRQCFYSPWVWIILSLSLSLSFPPTSFRKALNNDRSPPFLFVTTGLLMQGLFERPAETGTRDGGRLGPTDDNC